MTTEKHQLDWTVNVYTLLMILIVILGAGAGFARMEDKQQSLETQMERQGRINEQVSQALEGTNRILTTWEERMKDFPLHKHVGKEIVYPAGTEPDGVPAASRKDDSHEP